jgi:predicted secreted acid phosphatase
MFFKIKSELTDLNIPNSIIFFDIDSTLIDEKGRAILPVLDFYNFVKKQNIKPVIITARHRYTEIIDNTKKQLYEIGITFYYQLIFRDIKEKDIKSFKERSRKIFHDDGYFILMSVGDMNWDIGSYGGIGILV